MAAVASNQLVGWQLQQVSSSQLIWSNTRIIPLHQGWTYMTSTHEYLNCPHPCSMHLITHDKLFISDISDGGSKQNKFARDLFLLETNELQSDPEHCRALFYAANSCYHLSLELVHQLHQELQKETTPTIHPLSGNSMIQVLMQSIHDIRTKAIEYYERRCRVTRPSYLDEIYQSFYHLSKLFKLKLTGGGGWTDIRSMCQAASKRSQQLKVVADAAAAVNDDVSVSQVIHYCMEAKRIKPLRLEALNETFSWLVDTRGDRSETVDWVASTAVIALRALQQKPEEINSFLFTEKEVYDFHIFKNLSVAYFYFPRDARTRSLITIQEIFRELFRYPHITVSQKHLALRNAYHYSELHRLPPAPSSSELSSFCDWINDSFETFSLYAANPRTRMNPCNPTFLDDDSMLVRFVSYSIDANGRYNQVLANPEHHRLADPSIIETKNVVFHIPTRRFFVLNDQVAPHLRPYQQYKGGVEDVRFVPHRDQQPFHFFLHGTRVYTGLTDCFIRIQVTEFDVFHPSVTDSVSHLCPTCCAKYGRNARRAAVHRRKSAIEKLRRAAQCDAPLVAHYLASQPLKRRWSGPSYPNPNPNPNRALTSVSGSRGGGPIQKSVGGFALGLQSEPSPNPSLTPSSERSGSALPSPRRRFALALQSEPCERCALRTRLSGQPTRRTQLLLPTHSSECQKNWCVLRGSLDSLCKARAKHADGTLCNTRAEHAGGASQDSLCDASRVSQDSLCPRFAKREGTPQTPQDSLCPRFAKREGLELAYDPERVIRTDARLRDEGRHGLLPRLVNAVSCGAPERWTDAPPLPVALRGLARLSKVAADGASMLVHAVLPGVSPRTYVHALAARDPVPPDAPPYFTFSPPHRVQYAVDLRHGRLLFSTNDCRLGVALQSDGKA